MTLPLFVFSCLGGYGLAAHNGSAFAGGALMPGTFGGHGDAPQGYMAAPALSYGRFPNHAQATAGFHPYRR